MKDSRSFWNKMAKRYDRSEEGDRPVYERALGTIGPYLSKDHRVLDIGCGTGTLVLDIVHRVGEVHGMDYSEAMIAEAERKAKEANIDHVGFFCGTLADVDFSEDAYDVIFSFYLLHLMEDLQITLGEVHNHLKAGGLFISLTPCLGETMVAKHLLKMGSVVGLVPKTRGYEVDELVGLIEKAGFAIERQETVREKTHEVLLIAKKKR